MRRAAIVLLAIAAVPASPALAPAGSPTNLCRRLGTSDALRPLPGSLVATASRLFGLAAMPADQIRRTTVFRCMDGHMLLCNSGANLPCGKADTRRRLPAAAAWCAGHPDSDFIPLYVTGHDSIYRWRCTGGQATTIGAPQRVDRRGFIARFWKRAD